LSSANDGNEEMLTRHKKIKRKCIEIENKEKSNALWDVGSDTSIGIVFNLYFAYLYIIELLKYI